MKIVYKAESERYQIKGPFRAKTEGKPEEMSPSRSVTSQSPQHLSAQNRCESSLPGKNWKAPELFTSV